MGHRGAIGRIAGALRRRERALAASYLVGLLVLVGAWFLPAVRAATSLQLQKLTHRAEQRWQERVQIAHEWVREERYPQAEQALMRLDAELPARHVKHALAPERSQVLADLAVAHAALGRKRRSLEAARRLVAFEPRNYAHHALHGALASQFSEGEEAVLAWQRVLAIHPNHLPTVRALASHHADRGDAAATLQTFRGYLDAFGTVPVQRGAETVVQALPVDGRWHDFDIRVEVEAGADPAAEAPTALGVVSEVADLRVVRAWRAGEPTMAAGGRVRLLGRIRAFKPVDPVLWSAVERACRNLLAFAELEALQARVRVVAEAGEGIGRDRELSS